MAFLGTFCRRFFSQLALTNLNKNFHDSNQASGADFGFFILSDKALHPELQPISRKLSFFDSCPYFHDKKSFERYQYFFSLYLLDDNATFQTQSIEAFQHLSIATSESNSKHFFTQFSARTDFMQKTSVNQANFSSFERQPFHL